MKPCHVLSMFLTFWHLRPYVLIWFVLMKKNVYLPPTQISLSEGAATQVKQETEFNRAS